VASIFSLAGATFSKPVLAVIIGIVTAGLLVIGRYRIVETVSTMLVAAFVLCTVVAVGALQLTPYAITGSDLATGFSFQLPSPFTIAFAAFGIIGVGASELIYYPYWCLEKGYARNVGRHDGTPERDQRARGWMRMMRVDAWVSCAIYTLATVAFYVLGAAVLHARGLDVRNADMIPVLSQMYRETFGAWSFPLFLLGAFAVLYSTIFVATASNARLVADALAIFKLKSYATEADRRRMVRWGCALVPAVWVLLYVMWEAPITLVLVGAIAQGLMLPFLALTALWLNYRRPDSALTPTTAWRIGLWLATVGMVALGVYQLATEIGRMVR
jgi:manganese transport protein